MEPTDTTPREPGSGPLVIDPAAVPATPWRNGAGVTRELWVSAGAAPETPDWRLSLAELTADAPFSAFPGLDRVFLPLAGDISLTIGDRVVEAVAYQPIRFGGEDPVSAEVRAPGRALNLMVRRGVLLGDLRVRPSGGTAEPAAAPVSRSASVAALVRFDGFTVEVLLTREAAA